MSNPFMTCLLWPDNSGEEGSSHRPQDHWEPGQQSRGESWGKTLWSVSHFCKIGFASNLALVTKSLSVSWETHGETHDLSPTMCPCACTLHTQLGRNPALYLKELCVDPDFTTSIPQLYLASPSEKKKKHASKCDICFHALVRQYICQTEMMERRTTPNHPRNGQLRSFNPTFRPTSIACVAPRKPNGTISVHRLHLATTLL